MIQRGKIKTGFTLVEILVAIAIIGIVATIATILVTQSGTGAADKRRIADMDTIGRFLGSVAGQQLTLPSGIPADGDLQVLVDAAESQANVNLFLQDPRDPNATSGESGYQYIFSGGRVVVFANLTNVDAEVTLAITEPTPGAGNGTFEGTGTWVSGYNGTNKYYQVSN